MPDAERKTITSALGHEYPLTMLGIQAAEWDAAILAERQRVKPLRERVWRKLTGWTLQLSGPPLDRGDGYVLQVACTRVSLHATCLVAARTERTETGWSTWYPLHVRWGWSKRRGRPHWYRATSAEDHQEQRRRRAAKR